MLLIVPVGLGLASAALRALTRMTTMSGVGGASVVIVFVPLIGAWPAVEPYGRDLRTR